MKELLYKYGTSLKGLSETEAEKRLKIYGHNSIDAKAKSAFELIKRDLLSPTNLMILLTALVFFVIKQNFDAWFSFFLFVLNFMIIFVQEFQSEKEFEQIQSRVDVQVNVKRQGKFKKTRSAFVVPGDIIRVRVGETVPADGVILKSKNLLVDESSVTGESSYKEKNSNQEVYSSSIIRRGWATVLITRTGRDTKYGKVISLIHNQKNESNLELLITRIGKFLIKVALILSPLVFLYSMLVSKMPWYESLVYSLLIFISFIPAALPAVSSSIMIEIARKLGKHDILIRRLSSIFDIGTMNVLCADKTGTLTQSRMKLDKLVPLGCSKDKLLFYALTSSDPDSEDPIDSEIVAAARKKGIKNPELIEFHPYDSVSKFSDAVINEKGKKIKVMKGSPEIVLKKLGAERPKELDRLYDQSYRVIAVARNKELLGFLGFYDPPIADAKDLVSSLRSLGIRIKMLTGDSLRVAVRLGNDVGINGKPIDLENLNDVSKKQYNQLVKKYEIFADVFPEDKYQIVQALRENGNRVGVTGDGINDIGALKRADIGMAVSNATTATKSFSDAILTSPGLRQIIEAIKLSRKAINRLENYVVYRLAEDLRYPFLLLLFLVMFSNPILSPIQVLLIKILNDIPLIAISFDKVRFSKKPGELNLKKILPVSMILGLVGILNSLFFIFFLKFLGLGLSQMAPLLFLKLILSGHFLIYAVRAKGEAWFRNLPSKQIFVPTFITQLLGTGVVLADLIFHNLLSMFWLIPITWAYALVWLEITDIVKIFAFRKFRGTTA